MMNASMMRGFPIALGVLLILPVAGLAQDTPPAQPPVEPTQLVFEREVFGYPTFARRNPFRPLDAADEGGPRYEQLMLIGILYSEDPRSSVAIMSTGGVVIGVDGTMTATEGDAFYLKVGQTMGNVTIVEIHRETVVVDVEEFGLTDRKTMQFISRQGGIQ